MALKYFLVNIHINNQPTLYKVNGVVPLLTSTANQSVYPGKKALVCPVGINYGVLNEQFGLLLLASFEFSNSQLMIMIMLFHHANPLLCSLRFINCVTVTAPFSGRALKLSTILEIILFGRFYLFISGF
jgi:hypothetical protein